LLATHCADPLAGDCRRTLTCNPEQGPRTLDPDCIWHNPDGSVWNEGPTRDIYGDWYWNDGSPVGQSFVCGGDAGIDIGAGGTGGISVGGSSGAAGGGTGGTGGGEPDSGRPPEEMPLDPNCSTNDVGCTGNLECDPVSGNCVGCIDNDSCTLNAPRCLISTKTCVACLQDTDCGLPGFARCDLTTNTCSLCNDPAQCARFGDATQCNELGKCVKCLVDDQCTATPATPLCRPDTDSCVQCLEDSQCAGDLANAHCDTTNNNNTCVPCTDGLQCPDGAPLCRGNDGRCVECTGNSGANACGEADAANCNANGECVPCALNGDCTHLGGLGVCDTSLNPNRCVQCATDNDCNSDTASRCVNNQCVECNNNNACTGQPSGNTVCDTAANPNRCVECTGTDFASCAVAGSPRVCNSVARTCTNSTPASAARCGDCVSDAQCEVGDLCVPQALGSATAPFCFPAAAAGGTPCVGFGAFRSSITTDSLDADNVAVCTLATTTCPARRDMLAPKVCATSLDCGAANVDDGICAPTDQGLRCTVLCNDGTDCGGVRTCLDQNPLICSP
jgi:hypothetical protein